MPDINRQPFDKKQLERLIVSGHLADILRIQALMFIEKHQIVAKAKNADIVSEDTRFRFPGHRSVLPLLQHDVDPERVLVAITKMREAAAKVLSDAVRNGDLAANKQGPDLDFRTVINDLSASQINEFVTTARMGFYAPKEALDNVLEWMDPNAITNAQRLAAYHLNPMEALRLFVSQLSAGFTTDEGIIIRIENAYNNKRHRAAQRVIAILPAGYDMSSLESVVESNYPASELRKMSRGGTTVESALAMPPASPVLPPPPPAVDIKEWDAGRPMLPPATQSLEDTIMRDIQAAFDRHDRQSGVPHVGS